MIEKVRLQNWKTHLDSSFEFGKGTNVLVGKMGSGKSSVMDAICFALFGTFPALQSRRVSLEEVIMNKPVKAEEAIVELSFSYGGKSYKVERKIKRKGSTEAKIYCEGKVVAGPKPRDVNQAVEKAIEINYNLFSRAVYSEQNEIDFFLRLAPKDRKVKFDELLDLQRYEQVRGNAVTALNRLKEKAREKSKWVLEQKQLVSKEEEKDLRKRKEEKEKENRKHVKDIEEKGETAKQLEKEVKELEMREKEFREAREKASRAKAVIEQLEKEIEKTKREKGEKGLEEIGKEREKLDESLKALGKEIEEREREKEEREKEGAEFGKELALKERKIEELNKHLGELEGLGPKCPTCRQNLEAKTRESLIKENREQAKKNATEMEQAMKKEAMANTEIQKLKKGLKEKEGGREKIREEKMKLFILKEALEKLSEKERQLKENREKVKGLEEKEKGIDFKEKELLEKRKKAIEEKALVESLKKLVEANRQIAEEIRTGLERIERTRKQIEEFEASAKATGESAEKMGFFVNSLLATQKELRESLVSTVNQAMHSIWAKVYPYKDYVSAKMDVAEGSYELKVKERSGEWVRVEGILSGGERSAAAICIRIAFSLVLARNLSWLILDEPTHNLDSTAVETLGNMMQKELPGLVEQIFVITHDKEMSKAASASLYILEREKDSDGATKPVLAPIQE